MYNELVDNPNSLRITLSYMLFGMESKFQYDPATIVVYHNEQLTHICLTFFLIGVHAIKHVRNRYTNDSWLVGC